MCGIAGIVGAYGFGAEQLNFTATRMTDVLHYRGPDDHGVWIEERSGLAFGHRRLSILDLSAHGHQPMQSACGRYVTVYNGEIYNFKDLRKELVDAGHSFRSHSDTEVLLAALTEWGLERAVQRFNGMFAFALWDKKQGQLHLARDRIGEKPLYYGWVGDVFIFGSELKSICAYPDFRAEINREALSLFFRYRYVPSPYSIYKGIHKLTPGTVLTISAANTRILPDPVPYWSLQDVVEKGNTDPFLLDESELLDNFEQLLADAVEKRMVSDVPLGAFLSGGIDSSTIVALMQSRSNRPVQTFSIGFNEAGYDEAVYAKEIASHIGTSHTELYVTARQAMGVIPSLPQMYDEPFADCSQIPTHLVASLARNQVTVSLSGDGGDELFAGYWRHFMGMRIWNQAQHLPIPMRKLMSGAIQTLSPVNWDKLRHSIDFLLPQKLKGFGVGDRAYKLVSILNAGNEIEMYKALVSDWNDSEALVLKASEPELALFKNISKWELSDFRKKIMYLDAMSYLPGDILTKVDRASMAVSLEARVPFLDPEIIEFASRVPMNMKIRNGKGKWLLRQLLARHVPESMFNRPKMGFAVPIDHWLRGPLRDWAEELLDARRLEEEGMLNAVLVRTRWQEHLSGKRNWQNQLWNVLMYQAWQAEWIKS
jgi:asparagine synthase (glutamine-hydrolysing)